MGVRTHGDTKGASKAEISKLEATLAVDEQIVRLEVTVEDSSAVAKVDAHEQLVEVALIFKKH